MKLRTLMIKIDESIADEGRGATFRQLRRDSCCLEDLWSAAFTGQGIRTEDVQTIVVTLTEELPGAHDFQAVHNFQWRLPVDQYAAQSAEPARLHLLYASIRDALDCLCAGRSWNREQFRAAAVEVARGNYSYRAATKNKAWSKDKRFGVAGAVSLTPEKLLVEAHLFRRGRRDPLATRTVAEMPPTNDSLHSSIGAIKWVSKHRVKIAMPKWTWLRKEWTVDFAAEIAAAG